MEYRRIEENKKQVLDLLLIADEQEDMIDRYLEAGEMHALFDPDLRCVAVVIDLGDGSCELKNIAVYPQYQGQGYGRSMIEYLQQQYRGRFAAMFVGTGDVPSTLTFYQRCGFRPSHRVAHFFTDHYDHPIYEEGVQLVDMVYLKMSL